MLCSIAYFFAWGARIWVAWIILKRNYLHSSFDPWAVLPAAMLPAALGWEAEGQAWSPCSVHSPSSELHLPEMHNINCNTQVKSSQKTGPQVQKNRSAWYESSKMKTQPLELIKPRFCYVLYVGHTTLMISGRTVRAPYLRNPLIAESTTRMRPESPQGEEDWCEGVNDWTNSRENEKCLQTIVSITHTASSWFPLQYTPHQPASIRSVVSLALASAFARLPFSAFWLYNRGRPMC